MTDRFLREHAAVLDPLLGPLSQKARADLAEYLGWLQERGQPLPAAEWVKAAADDARRFQGDRGTVSMGAFLQGLKKTLPAAVPEPEGSLPPPKNWDALYPMPPEEFARRFREAHNRAVAEREAAKAAKAAATLPPAN